MTAEKNAEIWSTRLQKELLALTSDNATDKETQVAGVLPAFIKVKNHEMDIAAGICKVAFVLDVAAKEDDKEDIVIVVDGSMSTKPDGSVDPTSAAYPFAKPVAWLENGADRFPEGSTIVNGSPVDIDCDWTPSLHLTDAVLNIGLQVKESILQGEPFHAAEIAPAQSDPVDDLVKGAKRFGAFLAKSGKQLVDKPKEARRRAKDLKKKATASDINIGDQINLMEAPWADCQGLYSCKAIRRPVFVEDAMYLAQAKTEETKEMSSDDTDENLPDDFGKFVKLQAGTISKAAGTSFAGAGAMFRSFKESAKSVLEESFLMITDTHIIELRSSKLNLSSGTVTFAISIELMAKLKFRRQESISLFFKPAPDDPLIFMCPDSAAAVHQIQLVLKNHGVKGKHTNAATQKAIHEALQLVQEIQAKERALEYQPSVDRVNEIMDLYRQAAERFELAGDPRHEEVVTHMRKFLAQPLTASILDGSFEPEEPRQTVTKPDAPVPEGEVLERTKDQLEADDDSVDGNNDGGDDDFAKNIDSIVDEAKADLDKINGLNDVGDDEALEGLDDLDAMLASADAELDAMLAT